MQPSSTPVEEPDPDSATRRPFDHRRLGLQVAAGTPCHPSRPDGNYWDAAGNFVMRPLRPTTPKVTRGFIHDFEPPPPPWKDAPKPRPYANMRAFVAKSMIDKPVYDYKPMPTGPMPQLTLEAPPTAPIPKLKRNPRYNYKTRLARPTLGPATEEAKPEPKPQPNTYSSQAAPATQPMATGLPTGPTPRFLRNPRYDYKPRAVRPRAGPKPKSESKPESMPTTVSAATPAIEPQPTSTPILPQPPVVPTPRPKPTARPTPRRDSASSRATMAPQRTSPSVLDPAQVMTSKTAPLPPKATMTAPPVTPRLRLTLLSHLEIPVHPHLWNPLPAPTKASPKGVIWSSLLLYVWPRHFPRVRSSPKSSVSYGLRWHVALLAKAIARAWDLITALDDLGVGLC
jgi:hypothetical protein